MTDQKLQQMVAEECGWTYFKSKHGHFIVKSPDGKSLEPTFGFPNFDSETGDIITYEWSDGIDLPNYPGSLDAIHAAEETLTPQQELDFAEILADLLKLDGIGVWDYDDVFLILKATARQRSIAFLLARGRLEIEEVRKEL